MAASTSDFVQPDGNAGDFDAPYAASSIDFDCQSCGACCDFSADWPRFSLESDAQLDRIPEALVAADLSGMACDGQRCMALTGKIGVATACGIYEDRPDVCRACMPGGDDCSMARAAHGFPIIAAPAG